MTYRRVFEESDLPAAGRPSARVREKSDLDFKETVRATDGPECAKDIAAFANALGGVILVGATERGGAQRDEVVYFGLADVSGKAVLQTYEKAGTEMCSPALQIYPVVIGLSSGKSIVAVNVDPSPNAFVASRSDHSPEAWVLPIRVSSQTKNLRPQDLPMYMLPSVRRAYILLAMVPVEARSRVRVYHHVQRMVPRGELVDDVLENIKGAEPTVYLDNGIAVTDCELAMESVSLERGVVAFRGEGGSFNVPISDVANVWPEREASWAILLTGRVNAQEDGYRPMPIR